MILVQILLNASMNGFSAKDIRFMEKMEQLSTDIFG